MLLKIYIYFYLGKKKEALCSLFFNRHWTKFNTETKKNSYFTGYSYSNGRNLLEVAQGINDLARNRTQNSESLDSQLQNFLESSFKNLDIIILPYDYVQLHMCGITLTTKTLLGSFFGFMQTEKKLYKRNISTETVSMVSKCSSGK